MIKCDRCKRDTLAFSMSFLNTDMLCPACLEKEKIHPRYDEAKKAELDAVKNGNYNYPGLLFGQKIES